jgi:outer membrane immunogenic protein
MRLFVLCAAAVLASSQALAGSIDGSALRGSATAAYDGEPVARPERFVPASPSYWRWQGVYFGAHAGIAGTGMDFSSGTPALVASILSNTVVGPHVSDWTVLSKVGDTRGIWGGFVGYNSQWDGNLILGVEGNYSRVLKGGLGGSDTGSMSRIFGDDAQAPATHHFFYSTTVTGSARANIVDYATTRIRAGFAIDRFMPYAFAGPAVGRVDIFRSATVSYHQSDIPDPVPIATPPAVQQPPITPITSDFAQTQSANKKGMFAWGYAGGLGLEVALLPNVFLRAEWEYLQLFKVEDFKIHVASGRVGVGVKF